MYYFLTHIINDKLAGLEIAIINRLKIFKEMNVPAKIVTFHFNRLHHENMKRWGIEDTDMINMFDFFQNAVVLPKNFKMQNNMEQLKNFIADEYQNTLRLEESNNELIYFDKTQQKRVRAIRQGKNREYLSEIEWFDQRDNLLRRDGFDTRGFLSITTFYGQAGGVVQEVMYDIDGKEVINSYYHETCDGEIRNTALILKNGNLEMTFSNLDHLTAYFYDQISFLGDDKVTFIADRSYLVDGPLFLMKHTVDKYEFWHNTFTTNYLPDGPLVPVMDNEISSGQLKGYLVPTKTAASDLRKRLPESIKVYNIPVALNDVMPKVIPLEQRDRNKVILVARIEEQKNIPDALKAFSIIATSNPAAKLYIYGYILDQNLNKRLQEQVKALNLEDNIIFKEYTLSKDEIYRDAQLLIMTSRNEGWGMVINEALTYGVPVVSYNTNYGPSEIIEEAEDGYIVDFGDYEMLAKKSLELLSNDGKRSTFSQYGISAMKSFDLNENKLRWGELLEKL